MRHTRLARHLPRSARRVALAALLSLGAGCAPAAPGADAVDLQGFAPLVDAQGRVAPIAHGSWRVAGYGYRLEVDEAGVELLCETGSFVYRLPREASASLDDALVRVGPRPDTLLATAHPAEASRVLERVEPARSIRELDQGWTPEERFQVFAETMEEHFAFFELWEVDWQARVAAEAPRVDARTTDAVP